MHYSLPLLALVGAVAASPSPQGVTASISAGAPPSGCVTTESSSFEIETVNAPSKSKRQNAQGALQISLANGILTDTQGRTGYIASNNQFQFDKPPQAGAIYTAGWSICGNGSLALGGSNVFYQCLSGNFYNLYNEHWAAQCSPVTIETLMLLDCKK